MVSSAFGWNVACSAFVSSALMASKKSWTMRLTLVVLAGSSVAVMLDVFVCSCSISGVDVTPD